jgi:hypothetical protein
MFQKSQVEFFEAGIRAILKIVKGFYCQTCGTNWMPQIQSGKFLHNRTMEFFRKMANTSSADYPWIYVEIGAICQ